MLPGSILAKLESAHKNSNKKINLGVYYKNTLVSLCHALEDFILESNSPPLMITAFQRGKWYLQEAERYQALADKSTKVVIMACPDAGFEEHPTSKKPNVRLVSLKPDDPVAQEWHLVILSPTYTAMVLCQEISPEDYGAAGVPTEDLERKFYGFWTFEPDLVQETVDLLIEHIASYDATLAKELAQDVEQMMRQYAAQAEDDLGVVVTKVVDYLKASQENLNQPEINQIFSASSALDHNLLSNEMQAFLRLAQIIDTSDISNPMAAVEVSALAEAMAQLLDLPGWQTKRLRLAGLLHRLGRLPAGITKKIQPQSVVQQSILENPEQYSQTSLLRIMPQLRAVAKILYHQREAWDGSGVPQHLAYDAIPLESRILRLVSDFQNLVNQYQKEQENDQKLLTRAFNACQEQAAKLYDPKLVEALALLVTGMQQGLRIPVNLPKISSGMWLVDSKEELSVPIETGNLE